MEMRGLSLFISEIRKASSKELEIKRVEKELAKIRNKFKNSSKLKGYDRKKYICKLVYIYMMGYEIDFGHIEAINLLSSEKYSEKHMGYLACTLLLNEDHELVTLITNSIKRDLNKKTSPNEQVLALTAIASIGGKEQAESLTQDVQTILVHKRTHPMVRKKAALTLLRLYRKYPEILPAESWADRILSLLQSKDIGIIHAGITLLLGIVENEPEPFKPAVQKVLRIINKFTLGKDFPIKRMYYGVAEPWLQVKMFRFLQYFDTPEDTALLEDIGKVIEKIMKDATRSRRLTQKQKNVNNNNAIHAVLFEAFNLAIHYDSDKRLLSKAAAMLGSYLEHRDPNMRYLALDTLSRMALTSDKKVKALINQYQHTILKSLKNPDVSIRRKALDLVYSMCTRSSAGNIVGELLDYLPSSSYEIREELVLKIAILAERFATDFTWYVDVILNLLSQSGDFVSEEIWHRVIQIITNQDDELKKYSANTVFRAMQADATHENLVKVSAYILGEYGKYIADVDETLPLFQFDLIHSKFATSNTETRQYLLNSYIKFYNNYKNEEVRDKIKGVFSQYRDFIDAEIQQRANEYLNLASLSDESLMGLVLDSMPQFPERESSVMKKIMERQQKSRAVRKNNDGADEDEDDEEKGNSIDLGNANQNGANEGSLMDVNQNQDNVKNDDNLLDFFTSEASQQPSQQGLSEQDLYGMGDMNYNDNNNNNYNNDTYNGNNTMGNDDIFGADFGVDNYNKNNQQPDDIFGGLNDQINNMNLKETTTNSNSNLNTPFGNSLASEAALIASKKKSQRDEQGESIEDLMSKYNQTEAQMNKKAQEDAEDKYKQLILKNNGIAIEDSNLQIRVKSEFHGHKGRVLILYGNKTDNPINKIRVHVEKIPQLNVETTQIAPLLLPKTQIQQLFTIECNQSFSDNLKISVYFEYQRKIYRFNVKLPITVNKFVENQYYDGANSFFQAWNLIPKGEPLEQQSIFASENPVDVSKCKDLLSNGFNMQVLNNVDPKPANVIASGKFCSSNAQTPVLVRLESNEAKQMYRLTVRTSDETLSSEIHGLLKDSLSVV